MKNANDLLKEDEQLRKKDEPSPPQAERVGLWRILAVSVVLAVLALAILWAIIP